MLEVDSQIQIPETEFTFTFARSGGPGGQNVNKVNSKAVMHWDVVHSPSLPEGVRERFLQKYRNRLTKEGLLVLQSQRTRDQTKNVLDCLNRLRELILKVAAPPTQRRPTRPSRGAQQRRIQAKKQVSEKKRSRRPPKSDSY
ncbi:MAG: aminoacyl-tRNA hydrolase [Planctomycetaceae bacterium]|nr:aminoacyl-tRNA hydrolase [Planctomycetaceae bacterium]